MTPPEIAGGRAHPPHAPVRFRRAGIADAERLSRFARRVFHETFGPDNDPGDMAMYAERAFSPSAQQAELADPARICLLGEGDANGANDANDANDAGIAAYALLHVGTAPPAVAAPSPMEIERFYVDARWHGGGLADVMMDLVLDASRSQGCRTLWLGVWERNARAIRFYARRGFLDVGSHGFQLGTDLQTDRIMMRSVEPEKPHR